jgi:murein DD-endopeptidase MepM/ murein hydrolase activator NlpD
MTCRRWATAYPAAILRRALPIATAVAALRAGAGVAAGAPDAADAGSGPPTPRLKRVQCLVHCAGIRKTTVAGQARLSGHHLAGVTEVTFTGDPTDVMTAPDSTGRGSVTATVPPGAVSGLPRVLAPGGEDRSPQVLRIVDPDELPEGFKLIEGRVRPHKAFLDERGGIRLRYRFEAAERTGTRVEVVRGKDDRVIRSWHKPDQLPYATHARAWDGLEADGDAADDGRYRLRVGAFGGPAFGAGAVRLHGYRFPIRGQHGYGGYLQRFGAPRSGGRTHQGQDVYADCGTPLDAARGGEVQRSDYDARLLGNFIVIDGFKTKADFLYAHMVSRSRFGKGDRVHTGDRIGSVGQTGNARTTPCHLHFEIWPHGWHHGSPIDPLPSLRRWDGWS